MVNLTSITHLGQACISISCNSTVLVCDPWFSSNSQCCGWSQYPKPAHDAVHQAFKATHIYISHDHEDHFDIAFLQKLDPVILILPEFQNFSFRSLVDRYLSHHHIIWVSDRETYQLSDNFSITIYLEKPYYRSNSAAVITTQSATIFNGNDCGFDSDMLLDINTRYSPDVSLYTMNFAANAYPLCFTSKIDSAEINQVYETLKREHLEKFDRVFELLSPKIAFAFAGPIIFSQKFNQLFNADPDLTDWRDLLSSSPYAKSYHYLVPGDRFTFKDASITHSTLQFSSRTYHLEPIKWPSGDESSFSELISSFNSELRVIIDQLPNPPASNLEFQVVPDGLDPSTALSTESYEIVLNQSRNAGKLTIRSSEKVLRPFLANNISYDTLQLSQSAFFKRSDGHDDILHNILKYCRDPLAFKAYLTSQTNKPSFLSCQVGNKVFRVPTRCPHEGEPLNCTDIVDSTITCPRHGWVFDLETRKCVKGGRLELPCPSSDE